MREYWKIEIPDWDVDILLAVHNDRIVDPQAIQRIEHVFPDFEHRFLGKPWSEFKKFIKTQYRTVKINVYRQVTSPGHYS